MPPAPEAEQAVVEAEPSRAPTPGATAPVIEPGTRVGPVDASASEAMLRERLGADHVVREPIYLGEGYSEIGTVLYPADPSRTLHVLWHDSTHTAPVLVRILGSAWQTKDGLRVGMPLTDVEALNGRPFTMAGLEWDHAGEVRSWEGGHLDDEDPYAVVQANLADYSVPDGLTPDELGAVLGDQVVSSDDPVMQRLNPRVSAILIQL